MPSSVKGSETSPFGVRRTSRAACERCRKQKLQCVKHPSSPTCARCLSLNTLCVYQDALPAGRPRASRRPTNTDPRRKRTNTDDKKRCVDDHARCTDEQGQTAVVTPTTSKTTTTTTTVAADSTLNRSNKRSFDVAIGETMNNSAMNGANKRPFNVDAGLSHTDSFDGVTPDLFYSPAPYPDYQDSLNGCFDSVPNSFSNFFDETGTFAHETSCPPTASTDSTNSPLSDYACLDTSSNSSFSGPRPLLPDFLGPLAEADGCGIFSDTLISGEQDFVFDMKGRGSCEQLESTKVQGSLDLSTFMAVPDACSQNDNRRVLTELSIFVQTRFASVSAKQFQNPGNRSLNVEIVSSVMQSSSLFFNVLQSMQSSNNNVSIKDTDRDDSMGGFFASAMPCNQESSRVSLDPIGAYELLFLYIRLLQMHNLFYMHILEYLSRASEILPQTVTDSELLRQDLSVVGVPLKGIRDLQVKLLLHAAVHHLHEIERLLGLPEPHRVGVRLDGTAVGSQQGIFGELIPPRFLEIMMQEVRFSRAEDGSHGTNHDPVQSARSTLSKLKHFI